MKTQDEFDALDRRAAEIEASSDAWSEKRRREREALLADIHLQPADVRAAIARWVEALPPFTEKRTYELTRPVANPYAPYADQRVERGEAWYHRPTIPAGWRVTIEHNWTNVWRPGDEPVKRFVRRFEDAKRDVTQMPMTAIVSMRIAGVERMAYWEHRYIGRETVDLEFRDIEVDERGVAHVPSTGLRKRERESILAARQLYLNILAALSPECDDLDALQRNRGLGNGTTSLARKLIRRRVCTLADIKAALDDNASDEGDD